MFVAAQWLPGDAVNVRQPVDATAGQYHVHRRGGHAELAGDLHRAPAVTPPQTHDPAHRFRGCELRSAIPAGPSARQRSAHFLAVRGATMNNLAAAP